MTAHRSPGDATPGDGPESTAQPSLSRRALLAGSAGGLASLSGCLGGDAGLIAGKRDESTSTYDVDEGILRVDAEYGNVTVREGSDEVRVRTVKSGSLLSTLSEVTVSSERDGDAVVVRSRSDGDPWFFASMPKVEIDVELPSGMVVESMALQNGNADIADVSVADGATIGTENGNADARRLDGDCAVETENGNVDVEDVAGFVEGRSENGNVDIRGCDGVDGAVTENGNVDVEVAAIRGDTTLRSENGNVDAALAADLDAHVTASTNMGNVDIDDFDAIEKQGNSFAEGTLGEGTNDLDIETTNGNVSLDRLS